MTATSQTGNLVESLPSCQELRRLLSYDPDTGDLWWRPRSPDQFIVQCDRHSPERFCKIWNKRFAGKMAFTWCDQRGVRQGRINGVGYKAHRVIWKLCENEEPETIDHINGDPGDNRLDNLRPVSHRENMRNVKLRSDSSSGVKGVSQLPNGSWRAYIEGDHLGSFATLEEAVAARKAALKERGYHPNHGSAR